MATYGYLIHHGIKGQKWGIRRFQNPDGSLTPEGRARYGISDTPNYRKNLEDVKKSNPNNKDISGYVNALSDQSDTITDIFNKYTESSKKDYENFLKDPKSVDKCVKYLKSEEGFGVDGDQVDDPDFVESVIEDYLRSGASRSKQTKEYAEAFRNCVDDYRNSAEKFTKDIVGDLGNETIKTYEPTRSGLWMKANKKSFKDTVKNILHDSSNSQWVHYLSNHEEMAYAPYFTTENLPKNLQKAEHDFIKNAMNKYMSSSKGSNNPKNIKQHINSIVNDIIKDVDDFDKKYGGGKYYYFDSPNDRLFEKVKGYSELPKEQKNKYIEQIYQELKKKGYEPYD